MNKLTAEEFRSLCDGVAHWRDSLGSARASEVSAEAAVLQSQIRELVSAQLARRNPELERRRDQVLESARRELARRIPAALRVTLTVSGTDIAVIESALSFAADSMPEAPEQRIQAIRQALRAALVRATATDAPRGRGSG